jgi:hypothetical protein
VKAVDAVACRGLCEADTACALYSFIEEGCKYGPQGPDLFDATLTPRVRSPVIAAAAAAPGTLAPSHIAMAWLPGCPGLQERHIAANPNGAVCNLQGGCCWLKSEEVAGHAPTIDTCACTGYVRAPPDGGFQPKGKPPAKPTNVMYVLVDDLRPELEPFGQAYGALLQYPIEMAATLLPFPPEFRPIEFRSKYSCARMRVPVP